MDTSNHPIVEDTLRQYLQEPMVDITYSCESSKLRDTLTRIVEGIGSNNKKGKATLDQLVQLRMIVNGNNDKVRTLVATVSQAVDSVRAEVATTAETLQLISERVSYGERTNEEVRGLVSSHTSSMEELEHGLQESVAATRNELVSLVQKTHTSLEEICGGASAELLASQEKLEAKLRAHIQQATSDAKYEAIAHVDRKLLDLEAKQRVTQLERPPVPAPLVPTPVPSQVDVGLIRHLIKEALDKELKERTYSRSSLVDHEASTSSTSAPAFGDHLFPSTAERNVDPSSQSPPVTSSSMTSSVSSHIPVTSKVVEPSTSTSIGPPIGEAQAPPKPDTFPLNLPSTNPPPNADPAHLTAIRQLQTQVASLKQENRQLQTTLESALVQLGSLNGNQVRLEKQLQKIERPVVVGGNIALGRPAPASNPQSPQPSQERCVEKEDRLLEHAVADLRSEVDSLALRLDATLMRPLGSPSPHAPSATARGGVSQREITPNLHTSTIAFEPTGSAAVWSEEGIVEIVRDSGRFVEVEYFQKLMEIGDTKMAAVMREVAKLHGQPSDGEVLLSVPRLSATLLPRHNSNNGSTVDFSDPNKARGSSSGLDRTEFEALKAELVSELSVLINAQPPQDVFDRHSSATEVPSSTLPHLNRKLHRSVPSTRTTQLAAASRASKQHEATSYQFHHVENRAVAVAAPKPPPPAQYPQVGQALYNRAIALQHQQAEAGARPSTSSRSGGSTPRNPSSRPSTAGY